MHFQIFHILFNHCYFPKFQRFYANPTIHTAPIGEGGPLMTLHDYANDYSIICQPTLLAPQIFIMIDSLSMCHL